MRKKLQKLNQNNNLVELNEDFWNKVGEANKYISKEHLVIVMRKLNSEKMLNKKGQDTLEKLITDGQGN